MMVARFRLSTFAIDLMKGLVETVSVPLSSKGITFPLRAGMVRRQLSPAEI